MSHKPNPVAATAAFLMARSAQKAFQEHCSERDPLQHAEPWHLVADLASRLHRHAPMVERIAVGECNGDFEMSDTDEDTVVRARDRNGDNSPSLVAYWQGVINRNQKALGRLMERLKPYRLTICTGGDPRGCTFYLVSDANTYLPLGRGNGFDAERWNIG